VSTSDASRPARDFDRLNKWQRQHHHRRLSKLAQVELVGESMERVLETIAGITEENLPATRGVGITLWDPQSERYLVASSTVPGQDRTWVESRIRSTGGATRWIIDRREPVVVGDVADDPFGPNPLAIEHGVGAYAGVPIIGHGEVIGVLYAMNAEPTEWFDIDLHFLHAIANRAAMAITNARLFVATRAARDRAQAVSEVGEALIRAAHLEEVLRIVVDGVAGYLFSDRVILATFDFESERVQDFVVGGPESGLVRADTYGEFMEGLTGAVVRDGITLISRKGSPDARESEVLQQRRLANGSGSIIVAPLVYSGRVIGTLTAIRSIEREDYTEDEAALLTAMANQSAVAIEQARLRDATRAALTEMQALHAVSEALTKVTDPDDLLRILAEVVSVALDAEYVSILLTDLADEEITRAGYSGPDHPSGGEMQFSELWEGLGGWSIRHRQSTTTRDGTDPRLAGASGDGNTGPMLAVPLLYHGKPLGVLLAANLPGAEPFDARSLRLGSAMAGQISAAMAHALLFEATQRLAATDELTGIHNRRRLFDLAEHEFRTAVRYRRPLSAAMIDLDNFKSVNDSFGHAVGDEVLVEVVRRCAGVIRDSDIFGRYGGEEFAIVLPETGHRAATALAERLRQRVAAEPVLTSAGSIPVTVSIGVAELAPEISEFHTLLDHADAALFLAKHRGRNRVAVG
jgi:diguanylate cyclase (GGDEF)-like protein